MKKLLSLIVLIAGVYHYAFSQVSNSLQVEPFKQFSPNRNMERFRLGETILRGHLNHPFNNKNSLFPEFSVKNRSHHVNPKGSFNSIGSFGNMPCLKSQGNFPMPVYKPDSTIHFSLLIKKVEKVEMDQLK